MIVAGRPEATRTFGQLDRRSAAVAARVRAAGLGPGDHVALLMENGPDFLEVAWGAQRSGLYWTPVNWHLSEDEAAHVVDDCGARVLFAGAGTRDLAGRVRTRCPRVELALVPGGAPGMEDLSALAEAPLRGAPADEREGIYFFYSSGTTGMPKGIKPAHAFPPLGTGLTIDHVMARSFGFDRDSVYLCPAPLYHAAPIGWTLGTQRHGGTAVVMERFDPLECLRAIETHRVTHAQFVPTHFVRLLKLPPEQRQRFDLSSLRVVVHAAAPCPVEVKHRMIDWLGPIVTEFYAGSEGSGMTVITSTEWLARPGSVGRAAQGEVHVVGEDGEELAPGEIGTVRFAGGGSFEYHNDPEKTARAFDHRGWSTLGDLGHLDAEGYLYLADRRTDLIISGGANLYPAEIEAALVLHPDVADVAVIGVPDEEMGQSVLAVVQPAEGARPDPDELRAHVRARLAGFKVPRHVAFTDEVPRLPTGKLLRRRVREQYLSASHPTAPAPGVRP